MQFLPKNRLADALNRTTLAMISEAQVRGAADSRELIDLACRLDEMRVRLSASRGEEADIEHWPACSPA